MQRFQRQFKVYSLNKVIGKLLGLISVLPSVLSLFCVTFGLILCLSLPPAEASPPSLPVIQSAAEYGYPPLSIVSENGEASGFAVELLRASLRAMGYDVKFNVGSWPEVKQSLVDKKIQVLPLVGRTPEREGVFDFTFPYLNMHGTIVVRENEQGISKLEDLAGRSVAVLREDSTEDFLRRSQPEANIVTTESFENALRGLAAGQYDAVVIQKLLATQIISKLGIKSLRFAGPPLKDFVQSFCFAVPKGASDLLSVLNEGLSIVIADGTSQRLRQKWFASIENNVKSRLIIGGDNDYPPYEYLDENGQPAGFNVDLTRAIAQKLNLDVQIRLDSWGKIRKSLSDGDIDLVQGMFYSLEREKVFDFSPAYSIVGHSIVTRKGEPKLKTLQDLKGKAILVMDGDIMHDIAVGFGYGKQLITVKSQEEALQRLADGEADCVLVARIPAMYWIRKNGWSNLAVGQEVVHAPEYCYAVLHGNEAILARFSETLAALKASGEYRKIYSKWFGIYEEAGLTPTEILKYSSFVVGPVLMILIGIFFWNRSLKRQVRKKTRELIAEIKERKQAEEGAALMTFAINHINDEVYLLDETGRIKYANDESCQALGYSRDELIGMTVTDVGADFPIEQWDEHWQLLQEQGVINEETFHRRKDGTIFPVAVTANYFKYSGRSYNLALVRDITEQKHKEKERLNFEKQMVQTQKLESLGVLAGGIAHDFNNLLAAIMGHSELSKRRLPPGSAAFENLKQIENAAERAADLAKQMLAYSGKGKFVVESINLNHLLEEMLHMLKVTISKKAVLRLSPSVPLPTIEGDSTQIRQIIMNLVINASEAIGDRSGTISILTGCMNCDESYLKDLWLDEDLTEGYYVYLEVADTGCGMDKKTMSKLFDPFFTTKFTGRGLGMSAVMGIVRGHKGAIKVYSEVGKGTTFKILLPASEKTAEAMSPVPEDDGWVGSGKVLLVDDEETVLGVGLEMLKELGFSPVTASDGREALRVFEGNPDIALVLLDLTMPKMDGEQCYRELKRLDPNVKVIMSSGYNEYEVSQRFLGKGIAGFIQKPYKLSELMGAIRQIS